MSERSGPSPQPHDPPSDLELMRAVARGDAGAFEELYQRYTKPVGSFFYRMCFDAAISEDCLQETFIKVWKGAPTYRGQGKFTTWLFQIAKNHWLTVRDRVRRHRARGEGAAPGQEDETAPGVADETGDEQDPHAKLEADELAQRIREAIGGLDETQRIVFALAALQGLSQREIAEVLEMPLGTIKGRMARASAEVRRKLIRYVDA